MQKSKKAKKCFFTKVLLFALFFLFFSIEHSFAAMPGNITTIPQVAKYYIDWAINLSAVLAGIIFAIGAVQYLISIENPTAKKDAKDKMLGSLIGLILLLSSYLILTTINSELGTLKTSPLMFDFGIYYNNGNDKENKPTPMTEGDVSIVKKAGYNKIIYKCLTTKNSTVGSLLIISFFPEKNFYDPDPNFKNTKQIRVPCGESTTLDSGESFKISFLQPGVYLFMEDGCNGFMSESFTADSAIPEPFKGKAKSATIIGSAYFKEVQFNPMVIFQSSSRSDGSGLCTAPFYDRTADNCFKINIAASSMTFIKHVDIPKISWIRNYFTKGMGLKFYSKPWGWAKGSYSGWSNELVKDNNSSRPIFTVKPSEARFNYDSCTRKEDCESAEYKNKCQTFEKCPGSIHIIGNYTAVLYDKMTFPTSTPNNVNFTANCQIFRSNINSIKETEFSATGKTIQSIMAIFNND